MSARLPIDFGARRALFDGPESYHSQLGVFATMMVGLLRAVIAKPLVDLEQERMVFGRKQVQFNHITDAKLEVTVGRFGRDLALRFGAGDGPKAIVFLRHGAKLIQTVEHQRIVLKILAGSQISVPTSLYDPTGAFVRCNFPTNLTKEQAIEVVANPPGQRESLPIPW